MAKLRYYGEKFKPTKGAFGNKSKFQRSLERQEQLKKQLAEFEAKRIEAEQNSKQESNNKANEPQAESKQDTQVKSEENAESTTE
jgi:hypothetical protein